MDRNAGDISRGAGILGKQGQFERDSSEADEHNPLCPIRIGKHAIRGIGS
jgi:hypothetical protein